MILRHNISIHIEQLEAKTEEPNWPSGIKAKGLGHGEKYDDVYDSIVFPNGSKITLESQGSTTTRMSMSFQFQAKYLYAFIWLTLIFI